MGSGNETAAQAACQDAPSFQLRPRLAKLDGMSGIGFLAPLVHHVDCRGGGGNYFSDCTHYYVH